MEELKNIIELLGRAIKDDAQNLLTQGGIIQEGFDPEVDELRNLVQNSHQWLGEYTQKLIDETQISTLKIKYTQAGGYFIEVPLSQKSKIPDSFIHKTTLVNALRFTTSELSHFEGRITNAESSLYEKEYHLFQGVCEDVMKQFQPMSEASRKIARLDFLTGLSQCAYENHYVAPEMHDKYDLSITGGRHPVIEKIEKTFISNSLSLDSKNFVHIITGPNMGGKSTFLRQNALIVLMAHMGSFVPATQASIPLTDKIFSRVGAQDNLFMGSSTFMVEMQEVANILNNSTQKSFVIIDEVGRGTSTYDGMSLAWAILRQNHDKIHAKTLFATHYHELVDESKKLPGVANFSVAVGENEDNIVFLRKIIPGSIKKSYGIEVARLAGLPSGVLQEAQNFLRSFEHHHAPQLRLGNMGGEVREKIVYKEKASEVEEILKKMDVNHLTPMQALNLISELKSKL